MLQFVHLYHHTTVTSDLQDEDDLVSSSRRHRMGVILQDVGEEIPPLLRGPHPPMARARLVQWRRVLPGAGRAVGGGGGRARLRSGQGVTMAPAGLVPAAQALRQHLSRRRQLRHFFPPLRPQPLASGLLDHPIFQLGASKVDATSTSR